MAHVFGLGAWPALTCGFWADRQAHKVEPPEVPLALVRQHLLQAKATRAEPAAAILLTIHYMEEAQALADQVCVMSKGEIASTLTPGA